MRVGHVASEARSARGVMSPTRPFADFYSSETFSSLLKLFISSFAWLGMKCPLGAMAPTGAAYPAAPRARSNLVRLANAAEKRAHAVGPTQRYVTRALPTPRVRVSLISRVSEISRAAPRSEAASTRGTRTTRIFARHLRHSSRGHASWPRGRW
jgi:hypothetical protein